MIENIVLSAGSTRMISQIGALNKLIEDKTIEMKNIKKVAGVSAGSILGILLVLNFTIDEIWDFVYKLDTGKLLCPNILNMLSDYGADDGNTILNLTEGILNKRTNIKNITFKQLYEIVPIHFTVVLSSLSERIPLYCDYINTPQMIISQAIRASTSIPMLFKPVTIDGNIYIDGGVTDYFPMHLFKDELKSTIGILVSYGYSTKFNCLEEYFMSIINLFLYQYYSKALHVNFHNHVVKIEFHPDNISMLNFNLDNETKNKLFKCGVDAVEMFLKK
jgi:predicted acylesterase/phospholipase RssA